MGNRVFHFNFLALVICIWAATPFAHADILFGAEFTFTNEFIMHAGMGQRGIVNIQEAVSAQHRLLKEYTRECVPAGTCVITALKNSYGAEVYKVEFPESAFWVQISTDPSVVEIQTKPSTLTEYRKAKPLLEKLFSAGSAAGIVPDVRAGGGHIHMDFASAFQGDARKFRNFLVDFMNNQELGAYGVFGGEDANSPHVVSLKNKQKRELRKIIQSFDAGEITTAEEMAEAINNRVYSRNPARWNPPEKYQALNLTRVGAEDGTATVEFRAIEAQKSPDEFLKQIELFERRVAFLSSQEKIFDLLEFKQMSPKEKAAAFRAYVEESGLNWDDYKEYVGKRFIDVEPSSTVRIVDRISDRDRYSENFFQACTRWFSGLGMRRPLLPAGP